MKLDSFALVSLITILLKSFDRPVRSQQNLHLKVIRANEVKFGENSLAVLGPKVWNRLPPQIKNAKNLSAFKRLIKTWDGVSCKCNLCRKTEYT